MGCENIAEQPIIRYSKDISGAFMRFSFSEYKNAIHKFQKKYINFFLAALLLAGTILTAGCGANSSTGENKKFEKYTEEDVYKRQPERRERVREEAAGESFCHEPAVPGPG